MQLEFYYFVSPPLLLRSLPFLFDECEFNTHGLMLVQSLLSRILSATHSAYHVLEQERKSKYAQRHCDQHVESCFVGQVGDISAFCALWSA